MQKAVSMRVARLAFVAAGALVLIAGCSTQATRDVLEQAREAERSGAMAQAHELFAQYTEQSAPAREMPDRNHAGTIPATDYRVEVSKFFEYWRHEPPKADSLVRQAVDGVRRWTAKLTHVTTPTVRPPSTLDSSGYSAQWRAAFLNQVATFDSLQQLLMAAAVQDSMSFLWIKGDHAYEYQGLLINPTAGNAVKFSVYYDGTVSLPVYPGPSLVILSAKKQFTGGRMYLSNFSSFEITAPATPSLISVSLNTRVQGGSPGN